MAEENATGLLDEEQTTTNGADPSGGISGQPADAAATESERNYLADDLAATIPDAKNLDMLLDVNLKVTVELGRTRMKFRDVMNLSSGSIIELVKQTSEPVDILVNDALLATGEVVVMDDHFAVRITKLLNRVDRVKKAL